MISEGNVVTAKGKGGWVKADTACYWEYIVQHVHVHPRCSIELILKHLQGAEQHHLSMAICSELYFTKTATFHQIMQLDDWQKTNCLLSSSQKTFKWNQNEMYGQEDWFTTTKCHAFLQKNKPSDHEQDCSSSLNHSGFLLPKTFVGVCCCMALTQSNGVLNSKPTAALVFASV